MKPSLSLSATAVAKAATPLGRWKVLTAAAGLLLLGTAPMAWQCWLAPPWGEVTAQVMAGCDLHQGACRATFPDGSAVELALAPGPIPDDAAITLRLRTADFTPRSVDVDLNGETMNMGPNRPS